MRTTFSPPSMVCMKSSDSQKDEEHDPMIVTAVPVEPRGERSPRCKTVSVLVAAVLLYLLVVVTIQGRTLAALSALADAQRDELKAMTVRANAQRDKLEAVQRTVQAMRKLVPLKDDDTDCTAMRTHGWNLLQAHFAGCSVKDMFQAGFLRNKYSPTTGGQPEYLHRARGLNDLNWTAGEMRRAGYSLNVTALYFTPLMFKKSGLSLNDACMVNKPDSFRIRDVRDDCSNLARSWHYNDELQKQDFPASHDGTSYAFQFRLNDWEALVTCFNAQRNLVACPDSF